MKAGLPVQVAVLRRNSRLHLVCLLVALLAIPLPLSASLGGDASSVQADQIHLQGTLRSIHTERYTVHEIHVPTGTVVREYLSPSGTVFAIAWQGPWPPDMRQLLGEYFDQYAKAAAAQSNARSGRRPMHVELPGLVVRSGGRPRSFAGQAFLPDRLPEGVSAEQLQ